jgi:hypothetical protein
LVKRGSNAIYNTIPRSREWLTINYAINDVIANLLRFYIFKGERLQDNYIKFFKPRSCMARRINWPRVGTKWDHKKRIDKRGNWPRKEGGIKWDQKKHNAKKRIVTRKIWKLLKDQKHLRIVTRVTKNILELRPR